MVVVAGGGSADRRRLGLPAGQLADRYGGLAGEHEGQQVLLLPNCAAQLLAEQVSAELSAALRAPVTAGAAVADGSTLRATLAAHREAQLTLYALSWANTSTVWPAGSPMKVAAVSTSW